MSTGIYLKFADGQYRLKLGLAPIRELQDKTGVGIGALYARVLQGRPADDPREEGHPQYAAYHVDDLRETVRQGLIGGKGGEVDGEEVEITTLRAQKLVENYLDEMPLREVWDLAAAVLFATIEGYDDPDAKPEPEHKKKVTQTGS